MSHIHILGIGSPAGDDQAGWLTIDALFAAGLHSEDGLVIEKLDRPGTSLIPLLGKAAWVILVDAMQGSGPAGRIRHFDQTDWPQHTKGLSTHGVGVLDALSLACALGSLPPRIDLYGIEIGSANPGAPAADEIASAARQLAHCIAAALSPSMRPL
jgi:hydrogenase maturation protease